MSQAACKAPCWGCSAPACIACEGCKAPCVLCLRSWYFLFGLCSWNDRRNNRVRSHGRPPSTEPGMEANESWDGQATRGRSQGCRRASTPQAKRGKDSLGACCRAGCHQCGSGSTGEPAKQRHGFPRVLLWPSLSHGPRDKQAWLPSPTLGGIQY